MNAQMRRCVFCREVKEHGRSTFAGESVCVDCATRLDAAPKSTAREQVENYIDEMCDGDSDRWMGDSIATLLDRLIADTRAKAYREVADQADSEGHHWSGQPAHALFEFAEKLRSTADEGEQSQ